MELHSSWEVENDCFFLKYIAEANMLYLESPIGVGFSYSNNTSSYETVNDEVTGMLFVLLLTCISGWDFVIPTFGSFPKACSFSSLLSVFYDEHVIADLFALTLIRILEFLWFFMIFIWLNWALPFWILNYLLYISLHSKVVFFLYSYSQRQSCILATLVP